MKWRGRRASGNIVDRRGSSPSRGRGGGFSFGTGGGIGGGLGGGGGFRIGGGRGGILGIIIVVGLALLFGGDFLGGGQQGSQVTTGGGTTGTAEQEELKQFVAVVLADTEDVWHAVFRQEGRTYDEPRLVLFTGAIDSGCGYAQSAVGPFYCPADEQLYLDLDFFQELARRFGAPGDFAQAYVVAHEVGHHVQHELGILGQVDELRGRVGRSEANELSVRLELQADCFAGVFAHHADATKGVLEPGDIAEAMTAAAAIGDDRLQQDATGTVRPDSFTHGTSAQRQRWFSAGYRSGRIGDCDTFSATQL